MPYKQDASGSITKLNNGNLSTRRRPFPSAVAKDLGHALLRMMESELSGCENFVFFPALPEDRLVELYERSFGQIWFVQAGEKRPPNGGS